MAISLLLWSDVKNKLKYCLQKKSKNKQSKYLDEVNKFAHGEVLIQSIDRDGTFSNV